jgi:hypothetical protein
MTPSDYLNSTDQMLAQTDRHSPPDRYSANLGYAQVLAIEAVAAAIDRLAAAVEGLAAKP